MIPRLSPVLTVLSVAVLGIQAAPAIAAPAPGSHQPITEALAITRFNRISRVGYDLQFALDKAGEQYGGTATIRFDSHPRKADLFLDYAGQSVVSIILNGTRIPIRHEAGRIILPAARIHAHNVVEIGFRSVFDKAGHGIMRFVDPEDKRVYLYTDFEPDGAHRVFPCFDQPDLKAAYKLTVSAPVNWVVLGNRASDRREVAGDRQTVRFPATVPISPYLFAMHAGEYVSWHDKAGTMPLGIYARASLKKYMDAPEIFTITKQGLGYFADYFATAYPFGKYDQVFVPEYQHGAMENPGAVTFNEKFIYRSRPTDARRFDRDNVILHEMAHMWFGDLVTMKWWNGLWLNESFATYMAARAQQALPRYGDTWQRFYSTKQWAYETDQRATTHAIDGPVVDTEAATGIFDGITYGKGASVMKQLAYYMGETAFRDGLRTYFQRHAFGNSTLPDFMGALQSRTPLDLGGWSQVWLKTAGLNAVQPVWASTAGKITQFSLAQTVRSGAAQLRPHRTAIGLFGPNAQGQLVSQGELPISYAGLSTAVPAMIGKAAPSLVFPNMGDHDYAKVILDPVSLATAQSSLSAVADPFLRLQLWNSLSQMVRDHELDALAYLDLNLLHLPKETNPPAVNGQLSAIASLALTELDDATRTAMLPRIEAFLWAEAAKQPAKSDAQQQWTNTALSVSRTAAGQKRLVSFLQGKATFPGFELDPDMRWQIISILTACNHPEAQALLNAEQRRDPSDKGIKAAVFVATCRPDITVKDAAWKRLLTDQQSTISELTSVMAGFHHPDQVGLLQPFAGRYFDTIQDVYRTRENAFARRFVQSMFPRFATDPATLARADAMLKSTTLPAELRKWLTDLTEDLHRRAKIQTLAHQALTERLAKTSQKP
ncbi:MAG: aminopeptidase N [Candidatus Sericytochromatia bacterium]|nr:aminopeptidase N [Candidatus Sericytochromatia bacterium]